MKTLSTACLVGCIGRLPLARWSTCSAGDGTQPPAEGNLNAASRTAFRRLSAQPDEGVRIERVSRRRLLALAAALAAVGAAVVCLPKPARAVTAGFALLEGADPVWLIASAAAFLAAGLTSAAAWHRGLVACGAGIGRWQVIRRYGAGSFVNTVAPANAGEAVRVALLSGAIGSEGAAFTTIGVAAAVGILRGAIVAVLFVAAVGPAQWRLWLGLAGLAITAVLIGGVLAARTRRKPGRLAHLLDVARGAAADPAAVVEVCAWLVAGTAARVLASACAGAGLGLQHPIAAALVIVPTLELVGLLPLTPGNIGVTSTAVTLALHGQGVPLADAVGTGIALHAVETLVGLTFGGACALSFASWIRPPARIVIGAAAAAALLFGALTTTIVGLMADLA